jgi:cell division protein FtsI/penicillin-binding protein 2
MGGARAKLAAGVAATVIVAAIAAAAWFVLRDDDAPDPTPVARAYLAAWEQDDLEAMAALVADPPGSFADDHDAAREALRASEATYDLAAVTTDGDRARADFDATLMLEGLGEWSYSGRLRLERTGDDGAWEVAWTPAAIHPGLRDGFRLGRTRDWPERAPITDGDGDALVSVQSAVDIGLEPQRIEDRDEVMEALGEHLDVDPDTVDRNLEAPGVEPHHFVEIVTVPTDRYEDVRDDIAPVPGVIFRETMQRQGPSEGFAQHVLGRTGEITAELLEELGPPYQVGDTVGLTGLEGRFEEQLAGTPSGEIYIEPTEDEASEAEESQDEGTEAGVEVIDVIEGTPPRPLATTLDADIQAAVEAALADVETEAGAVVVDTDGNILATASRPLDEGFNRAFAGAYPPGSTFKVITSAALLEHGVSVDTPIDCPETVVAGGREFRNFEDTSLGTVPFEVAFAESCNTAFVGAVSDLSADDLAAAAERFGFNTEYSVGLTTAGGSFPDPEDATEQAAAAIGQGRVLASPLHMATVAGAVIDGTWEPPTLLPDPPDPATPIDDDADGAAPDDGDATDDGADESDGQAGGETDNRSNWNLDPEVQGTLADLMRLVVSDGSGTAASVPGADIGGKTGTAEFGSGDPPPTHAWFIGFRGETAVAVVLEGGGVGGREAAPIASEIFAALDD